MTSAWLLLIVVVLLLAASAYFVAAEFALVAARRTMIEPGALTSRRARATIAAMEDVSVMMACAQLGITSCGVLLGALGEPAVARLLEPVFAAVGVPEQALHPVALTIALLLVISAHVALGEMVPKNIALAEPEGTALALAPSLRAIARALGPVVRGLNHAANFVVRLLGVQPSDEVASAFTREEVAGMVAHSRAEGLLDDEEHERITSALDFDARPVAAVLVPDDRVVALTAGVSAAEVERTCARTGFSRFPVRGDDGTYIGYLHIRDVLGIAVDRRDDPVPQAAIRELPVLAPGTLLRPALDLMRRAGAHLAQVTEPVLDGAAPVSDPLALPVVGAGDRPPSASRLGLVMLEDVIEELIGEVSDATRRRPDPPA